MDCQNCGRELVGFLQGESSAETASALRAHLDSCARCRGRAELLRGVLRTASAPPPRPDGFLESVRRRIAQENRGPSAAESPGRGRMPSLSWRLATASLALLLAAVGIVALQRSSRMRPASPPDRCLAANCQA
ncbi:MAG: zf-HC2 domain-containing protein [Elusimicrobia bacterium]|nr:zf-HC2 domain-containing protein [Elusimicrobiota bacterium]